MIINKFVYYLKGNTIEAVWINEQKEIVKSRFYSGEQMDELTQDLGNQITPEYSALIATARSRVVPYVPPPPAVPFSVTPFQGKAAMYAAGLYDAVLEIINDPQTPILTKLAWAEVTEFTRDSPLLNGLAKHSTINLTDAEVDALFIAASQIEI